MTVADALLRANRTPGTPPGDKDDEHEDNTFALPNGNPIRRAFKRFARRQLKKILGALPEIGAPLPDRFPPLTDWTRPMASAMTPLIGMYWDEAGKTTRARLGLDPDAWEVHDPHLHEMISKASLTFCESTNATTDLQLGDALEKLRQEFGAGLVEKGEAIPQLAARVKTVFKRLSDSRAEMIARTESSRAVHAASLQSAKESGVVAGKKWLTSANSCDKCQAIAAEFNAAHPGGIPLDEEFAHVGANPSYASIQAPPLHPHCRCSITYALTPDYEAILAVHPPGSSYREGSLGPEPGTLAKPAPKPGAAPAEKPWKPSAESRFKRFEDGHQSQLWGDKHFGEAWRDSLTADEREAIRRYTTEDYRALNEHLRGIAPAPKLAAELLPGLDSALAKSRCPQGIVATRFAKLWAMDLKREDLKPGMDITDAGFASMSIRPDFTWEGVTDRFEVRIPKGTRGAYVNSVSHQPLEQEFLPARGQTFRVVEVTDDLVIVEIVPKS